METQTTLWADTMDGIVAFGVLGLGWLLFVLVRNRIFQSKYPDYDRHLSYAELMFVDSEFDRARAYAKVQSYPLWFRFAWVRDIALIVIATLVTIFAVYFAEKGIKMFTGGLVETTTGASVFKTKAYAPYFATFLGISLGLWASMTLSARSAHYRDFAGYVASMSKSRAVVHLEHFYRAGLITGDWRKHEPDLLVMIHERYDETLEWALKITAGLTALVFVFDIARGLI